MLIDVQIGIDDGITDSVGVFVLILIGISVANGRLAMMRRMMMLDARFRLDLGSLDRFSSHEGGLTVDLKAPRSQIDIVVHHSVFYRVLDGITIAVGITVDV